MSDNVSRFTDRLYNEWLPAFSNNRTLRNSPEESFQPESLSRLTDFDADWFLTAVDSGVVVHEAGFFRAPQSKATEQLFSSGSKDRVPRPLTLWIEPIITIGAVARLRQEFLWPTQCLGMQSSGLAFDIVGYSNDLQKERLVAEVKKTSYELQLLINLMSEYAGDAELVEPTGKTEKNAYRKVKSIRSKLPDVFWALGPQGEGQVFRVRRRDFRSFELVPVESSHLRYDASATPEW